MKTNIIIRLLSLALVFATFSCTTTKKLFNDGKDDAAVDHAIEKVRKGKAKESDVTYLQKAFNEINDRDAKRMESLMDTQTNTENWAEVHNIAKRIQSRQDVVKPYMPIVNKKTRQAIDLHLYDVDKTIAEAREKAAVHFYALAISELAEAIKGNRNAARNAFDHLDATKVYFSDYKDRAQLMDKAYQLGLNTVYFKMENNAFTILPSGFERAMLSVFVRDLDSKWVNYQTSCKDGKPCDYNIVANIQRIDISPERQDTRSFREEKEIQDGYAYILDAKGNVMKDSTGKDLKMPKYVRVWADVREVRQYKNAIVGGYLECYDTRTREKIYSIPINATSVFDNYTVQYQGDRRALSNETTRRLGNYVKPFPSDADILMDTADDMKAVTRKAIWDHTYLVER
jgi:hypothetical protein